MNEITKKKRGGWQQNTFMDANWWRKKNPGQMESKIR